MYLEDNDIDKLFSDLKSDAVTPPVEVKKAVFAQIGTKTYLWFGMALAVLIGIGSIILFELNSSNSNLDSKELSAISKDSGNSNNQNSVEFDKGDKSGNVDDKAMDSKNEFQTKEAATFSNENNELNDDNLNHKNEIKNSKEKGNLKKNQPVYINKHGGNKKGNIKNVKNTKNDNLDFNNNPKIKGTFNPNKDIKTTKGFDNNVLDYPANKKNNVSNNKAEKNNNFTDDYKAEDKNQLVIEDLSKSSYKVLSQIPMNMFKETKIDLRKSSKPKKVRFGIEMNSEFMYSNPIGNTDLLNQSELNSISKMKSIGFGVNGLLNYRSILFETGIGYSLSESNTNSFETDISMDTSITYQYFLDSNQVIYDSIPITTVTMDTTQMEVKQSNKFQYLSLPINIGYQFRLHNRIDLEVLAGVRFDFLTKTNSFLMVNGALENITDKNAGYFRKVLIQANIQLGFNFSLTEHISLGVYCPFRIGLNSRLMNQKALNYSVGGFLNLRYNF